MSSYLFVDDLCIFCQHEDVKKIANVLNKKFLSLCQWFIDNKLSNNFGEELIYRLQAIPSSSMKQ